MRDLPVIRSTRRRELRRLRQRVFHSNSNGRGGGSRSQSSPLSSLPGSSFLFSSRWPLPESPYWVTVVLLPFQRVVAIPSRLAMSLIKDSLLVATTAVTMTAFPMALPQAIAGYLWFTGGASGGSRKKAGTGHSGAGAPWSRSSSSSKNGAGGGDSIGNNGRVKKSGRRVGSRRRGMQAFGYGSTDNANHAAALMANLKGSIASSLVRAYFTLGRNQRRPWFSWPSQTTTTSAKSRIWRMGREPRIKTVNHHSLVLSDIPQGLEAPQTSYSDQHVQQHIFHLPKMINTERASIFSRRRKINVKFRW